MRLPLIQSVLVDRKRSLDPISRVCVQCTPKSRDCNNEEDGVEKVLMSPRKFLTGESDAYDQPCLPHRGSEIQPIPSQHTAVVRSEEHTSELQSLMRISSAVFCLKKKKKKKTQPK